MFFIYVIYAVNIRNTETKISIINEALIEPEGGINKLPKNDFIDENQEQETLAKNKENQVLEEPARLNPENGRKSQTNLIDKFKYG